ncbi:hypothetical protein D3C85_543920 [compost metagenome]
MESNNTNHRPDNVIKRQDKYTLSTTQLKTIFHYLQNHTATASMVSEATGIPQKSICRYKRDLEKRGLLCEVRKGFCELTKFRAWFLTTNPDLFPKSNQLKMF